MEIETKDELLRYLLYESMTGGIQVGVWSDARVDTKMTPELTKEMRQVLDDE